MKKFKSVGPDDRNDQIYIVKLYIAKGEQNSRLASENLKSICNEYLKGRCRIEEVDVLADFATVLKDKVFVTPTLILVAPKPQVSLIGNLANREQVVAALRLETS
jgi:circadian clock protein KaiB